MKQIKVLVFPCGSEVGLELHHALKDIRFVTLYGASSVADHGQWVYENYRGDIPYVTEKSCIDKLNECIDEWGIDVVFPAMDSVILHLSACRDQLHAKLMTSPDEAVRICRSKARTYESLAGCDFLPKTYAKPEDITAYPVFLKPAIGQGAQGACLIETENELRYELSQRDEEQVICEYLPGQEYTIDCFTDRNGELRYAACRGRYRIRNGISVNSRLTEPDEQVHKIAKIINEKIRFRGVWFFQLKRNAQGEYRLMECATRVAGTMCVERAAGVNLPLLTIFDALGMDVELDPQVTDVTVDRALGNCYRINMEYDEVYMDFDDTIIVHDRVNIAAMQFMYQCVQKKIPVILLTRHETDIMKDLEHYCISPALFSKIVCLPRSERKIDHVSPSTKAIFIDDSFAERKQMRDAFGIKAFGVECLEALIDNRQ